MKKNPWFVLSMLLVVFAGLGIYVLRGFTSSIFIHSDLPKVTSKNSILKLELEGVIMDGKKFLKQLKKYREDDKIKAIVIEVNSPGGVVAPSQEIYSEILKTREQYKKPVVVVCAGLMASGAYYAAVAADKIMVSPGAMMGSIGVIMEFVNLEKLYEWAKISRYTINTGKYKDSGAEYRAMRPDERELFQEMINDVFVQFKEAVAKGRNLAPEVVDQYADGRVFTGKRGVQLGFADELATIDEAYDEAADLAGIEDYDIFEIPKHRPGLMDILQGPDEEESVATSLKYFLRSFRPNPLANKPLYIMQGYESAW